MAGAQSGQVRSPPMAPRYPPSSTPAGERRDAGKRRPPRAVALGPGRQAGVGFAKLIFALGQLNRAISWTFPCVADAKRSATGDSRVVSCSLHTLLPVLTTP